MSALTTLAHASPSMIGDVNGWGHMGGFGWGMAVIGWILMVAIVALVSWLIWSTTRRPDSAARRGDRALGLLDERYARGEIDRDEYLERRRDLEERA